MNTQSRAIEEILRREGIPYKIIGGLKFYERKDRNNLNIKKRDKKCLSLFMWIFISSNYSSNFRTLINASCGTSTVPN